MSVRALINTSLSFIIVRLIFAIVLMSYMGLSSWILSFWKIKHYRIYLSLTFIQRWECLFLYDIKILTFNCISDFWFWNLLNWSMFKQIILRHLWFLFKKDFDNVLFYQLTLARREIVTLEEKITEYKAEISRLHNKLDSMSAEFQQVADRSKMVISFLFKVYIYLWYNTLDFTLTL